MYLVLDAKGKAALATFLVGLAFLFSYLVITPETWSEWGRTLTLSLSLVPMIAGLLGATPLWRWVWRKIPVLGEWIFPDLNGEWATKMTTNFGTIAEFHPDFADVDKSKFNKEIPGRFEIKANWFRIFIRFDSLNEYSTSDTITVYPKKDPETGRNILTYVYRNSTSRPLPTDEQSHLGAAYLEIAPKADVMKGSYWTNRMASKGLNTAGTLVATRVQN